MKKTENNTIATASVSSSSTPSTSTLTSDIALPQYTVRDIHSIVASSNIATPFWQPLPFDDSGQYVLMFYTGMLFTENLFLLEIINYCLKCNTQCQPRRVAFLFHNNRYKQFNAVIIQMASIDEVIRQKIEEILKGEIVEAAEDISNNEVLARLFRSIYKKVECIYIGK